MVKQTAKRVELYEKVNPPGGPIMINVDQKEMPDACLEEAEIKAAVRSLRSSRTRSTRGLCTEHIKAWLWGIVQEGRTQRVMQAPGIHGVISSA